jgi:drug/metabolite transporter (DMT)-like permease
VVVILHLVASPLPRSGTLAPAVVIVVLLAAVVHATWNAIAHGIPDHLVAFTWLGIGGMLGALPLVLIAPTPHAPSWPFLGTSIVLHVAYMVLLMQCYRLGDFSQVYPVARGVSPLVTTLLAALVVGEIPTPGRLAGVVVISAGLASLALLGRRPQGGALALAAAILTGLTIATYTTVDGLGVRLAGTAAGYTGWLILLEGSALPLWTLTWRRRALCAQGRAVAAVGMLGGLLSVLGYGLVLWAQTQGPLGPIAALRETSIIVGALIGAVVFHERFGRPRTVAAVVVAAGILVLTLG